MAAEMSRVRFLCLSDDETDNKDDEDQNEDNDKFEDGKG